MENVTAEKRENAETLPHLGSEYMDAQTYLAQPVGVKSVGAASKKIKNQAQHGLNDSDFGAGDQTQD